MTEYNKLFNFPILYIFYGKIAMKHISKGIFKKMGVILMKNSKKHIYKRTIISVLLMMIMFIGMNNIKAVTDDEYFAGNQLKQLGILKGYPDGTLKLEQSISRSEVATMMVRVRGYENKNIDIAGKEFLDVDKTYWAYGHVQNAYKLQIIQGYPDNTFRPLNNISYSEVVAIMVNSLGYRNTVVGDWPYNYINKAKEIGVIPKNSEVSPTKIITRGEMALIVWDTLLVKVELGL